VPKAKNSNTSVLPEKARRAKLQPEAPEKPKETTVEFLASLCAVLVVGLFIITFMVQAFEIPSSSMENALLIGDHVFVNRVSFAPKTNWIGPIVPYRDPRHGDIFVFLSPVEPGLYVVKRIIGTPGDRIHLRDGVVYRNGVALNEPYVLHDRDAPVGEYGPADEYRNNFPAIPPSEDYGVFPEWAADMHQYVQGDDLVVPPGRYFAMGDHRGVSLDSRYWGFVPRQNIIGRPMFIYWSFETPEDQYLKTAWSDRILFVGREIIHFFDQTRWHRTFRIVR
jgi:signal peptidase I